LGPARIKLFCADKIEDVPQRAAVAAGFVQVAGPAPGVVGDRDEPGGCGEVAGAGEGAQVPGGDQQPGTQDGAESGHGLDDRGLRMLAECGGDLRVKVRDPRIQARMLAATSARMPAAMSWPGRVIRCARAAATVLAATAA
jgi:hypothetical protein